MSMACRNIQREIEGRRRQTERREKKKRHVRKGASSTFILFGTSAIPRAPANQRPPRHLYKQRKMSNSIREFLSFEVMDSPTPGIHSKGFDALPSTGITLGNSPQRLSDVSNASAQSLRRPLTACLRPSLEVNPVGTTTYKIV